MSGGQIYGHYIETGKPETWRPIAAKKLDDGRYVLMVDTELELDAANIYISNIKVGSTDQTKANIRYLKVLDDGTVVTMSNPTQFYKVSDVDDQGAGNISYYGYTDVDGNWYILEEDRSVSPNTYRYAVGTSDYPTNWTNRAGLSYGYFYDKF
jgi:hypothetical protein